MKTILLISLLTLPMLCLSQDRQVACMKKFDEQLKGVGAEMTNIAGSFNYKTLLERATQCVQAGKCIKAEVFIAISGLMVDEEVIKVQREKLSELKGYFTKHKDDFMSNNYCAIVATFPAVMDRIQFLNRSQLDRFNVLLQQSLDALPKNSEAQ